MKRILAPAQRKVLERLAHTNVLLGFDFDGTLAPIVSKPDAAALRPSTRWLLARVAELYPCVVISGRSARDVASRVHGIAVRGVIGNHGLEPWRATRAIRREVERWRRALEEPLSHLTGVELEDKTFSLAVHYRRSRNKGRAVAVVRGLAENLTSVRIVGGKQVVNLVHAEAPHKGAALERERVRLGCDAALFVGDDETDEDVFALGRSGGLLTIRIGASRASEAAYCLANQREIDALLWRLAELRSTSSALHRRSSFDRGR